MEAGYVAEAGDSVEASDAVKVVGLWPLRAADQLLYFHPLFARKVRAESLQNRTTEIPVQKDFAK